MSPITLGFHFGVIHCTLGSLVISRSSLFLANFNKVAIAFVRPGHFPKFGRLSKPRILSNPSGAVVGRSLTVRIFFLVWNWQAAAAQIYLHISSLSRKLASFGPHLPPVRMSTAQVSSRNVQVVCLCWMTFALSSLSCDHSRLSKHHSIGSNHASCTSTLLRLANLLLNVLKTSTSVRYLPVLVVVGNSQLVWSIG